MSISVNDGVASVTAGTTVSYVVMVRNDGPSHVTSTTGTVTIADTFRSVRSLLSWVNTSCTEPRTVMLADRLREWADDVAIASEPGASCDAFSIGLGFVAAKSELGSIDHDEYSLQGACADVP